MSKKVILLNVIAAIAVVITVINMDNPNSPTAKLKREIEIECLRPNGAVVIYRSYNRQVTGRGSFRFFTTDGLEVWSSFCHAERKRVK